MSLQILTLAEIINFGPVAVRLTRFIDADINRTIPLVARIALVHDFRADSRGGIGSQHRTSVHDVIWRFSTVHRCVSYEI